MHKEPIKFDPVTVDPQPCSEALAREHLVAFANSFVAENYIQRWLHVTVDRPKKAYLEMVKFSERHNRNRCCLIKGSGLFPSSLEAKYGKQRGIYFDGRGPAVAITPAEAGMAPGDAIFSMIPGQLAIFLFHEGWAWHCENNG